MSPTQPRPPRLGRSLAEAAPAVAAQWHPTRNAPLTPAEVAVASKTQAWWVCETCGHQWRTTVANRRRTGCPACGRRAQARAISTPRPGRSLAEAAPAVAAQWHPTRNGDRDPHNVAAGSNLRAVWQCPTCGHTWRARVADRTRGVSCPVCNGRPPSPTTCTVPGCTAPFLARGLCRMHYSRYRRGTSLTDDTPQVGDIDGYGRYGQLDDDGATVLCHECGRRYRFLGTHVYAAHDMTARAYKFAHGLPLSRGLASSEHRDAQSQRSRDRLDTPQWQRLEAARDPVAASAAREPESLHSPALRRRASAHAKQLSQVNRGPLTATCEDCGTRLPRPSGSRPRRLCDPCVRARARAARALQTAAIRERNAGRDAHIHELHRQGGTIAAIAHDVGLSSTRVTQILCRPDTQEASGGEGEAQ